MFLLDSITLRNLVVPAVLHADRTSMLTASARVHFAVADL
jgi:hypothetical protein